jgi:hypothetical protein
MFCEIYIKHKAQVMGADLVKHLRSSGLGIEISTAAAHSRSVLYSGAGSVTSLFAHETVKNCFVILRSVNFDVSTFHLEGNAPTVTVETRLEATQEYVVSQLLPALHMLPNMKGKLQAVKLFEDNGKETGLTGRLPGLWSALAEGFKLDEIHSQAIILLTSFAFLALGRQDDKVGDAAIALGVTLIYALVDGLLKYAWGRHRLKFGFKET